jgi:hypothetical protein
MRYKETKRERGQAAIEFVFALIFIIAITAVLFQALNFELDVFNQSMAARYEFMDKAHDDQDNKPCQAFSIDFSGRKLGDVAPFEAPYQAVDENLRYGPKKYHGERGTKYIDTFSIAHEWYVWTVAFLPDHYEDTAGYVDDLAQTAFTALAAELLFRGC